MSDLKSFTNFIRSTFNEPTDFIPLHDPRFIGNEKKYMAECIDTNFVSSAGKFVGRFEKMYAGNTFANTDLAATNATPALHQMNKSCKMFSLLTKDSYLYKRKP